LYRLITFLLFFFSLVDFSSAQIQNSNFENWEAIFGDESPQYWDCNGLSFGACRRDSIIIGNSALRMDNSLPCTDLGQGASLGNGDINQKFQAPSSEFILSYNLVIDSLDSPASFVVSLSGPNGFRFEAIHDTLFNGPIEHRIVLEPGIDSLHIGIKPIGELKENPAHSCDLGFISEIIDDIQVEEVVSTITITNRDAVIYPNPSNGLIYIEQNNIAIQEIIVYDVYGKPLIRKSTIQNKAIVLDLRGQNNLLFIKLIYPNGNFKVQKVVIE